MIDYLLIVFAGYVVGRFGHVYLNVWTGNVNWFPHHWIIALALIIYAILSWHEPYSLYIFAFGIGHFISDLKDFLKLKFFEPDDEGPKKFWDID